MIGNSPAMLRSKAEIRMTAESALNPILITGERGTGKELAARMVHQIRCQSEPFMAVNCAAICSDLLESELFGHVKGAFTGATTERAGAIRSAGRGCLLLDEVSEMDIRLQAKLLRLLDGYGYRPVGSDVDEHAGCTIIATSNRDLTTYDGIRPDLLDRIRCGHIHMPTLWERRDDIPALVEWFIGDRPCGINAEALVSLSHYSWPGNVRELRSVIDRAVVVSMERGMIGSTVIDRLIVEPRAITEDVNLSRAEARLVREAMRQSGGVKTVAAQMLGICRATLYEKFKQHGLDRDGNLLNVKENTTH